MKEFRTWRLALTASGCFLGAGYVSGQELWKVFGAFGLPGFWGRVLALAVQLVFVVLLLRLGQKTGITSLDRALIPGPHPLLQQLAGIAQILFLFGVYVVMAAGAGALTRQLFPCLPGLGVPCSAQRRRSSRFAAWTGWQGVCAVLVPGMILVSLAISAMTIWHAGFSTIGHLKPTNTNPVLPNWWIAALTYVSYNIFGAVGVLTPIGPHVPDGKTARRGSALSVLLLLLISAGILLAMAAAPESASTELPMLALADVLSPVLGYVYAALLLCGMLGTSVSFSVAISFYLVGRVPVLAPRRRLLMAGLSVLAFAGSLLGFGDLVGTVYPAFGYLGFVVMACILAHWIKVKKADKAASQEPSP